MQQRKLVPICPGDIVVKSMSQTSNVGSKLTGYAALKKLLELSPFF